ncbi:MarR family transcriptional regulator [Sphingobacterium sp. UT-1RO-CII-1]|uniref:MarR family winged helix-turn-helix transcriptional regulator n=1 Tax=Sphingobacterium sp. UT-1RO-CII-1 TaxID=2995225 RepID=UPI00227D0CB5|nr:MarR family transcriptional regulator [Sphingobacterium sp. UT-1RO-CII-1]MCY4779877.1 MarR family transcriptional regulator [Sphingobacterium sp. UT-1RO-CII-1]
MNNTVEFYHEQPEESSGYLLWQVSMLWQRKMKRALDKLDLTHTQYVLLAVLAWLSKSNETVTQVDIANHSNTDRMMVSKVLRTLQEKGFINRHEHQTDTRAKNISLSKSGKTILEKAIKIVEETDNSFFSVLQSKEKSFNTDMRKLVKENSDFD